jgi:iron complex transport system permease protein
MNALARSAGFRRIGGRRFWLVRPASLLRLAVLVALAALLAVAALAVGGQPLSLAEILGALRGVAEPEAELIVLGLRLPRILLALLCGAMLGMAGAAMQSLTRNGLADPGLIGAKEGAVVAILLLVLGFPTVPEVWRPWAGLLGALGVAGLVMLLARSLSGIRFILVGIGVGWTLSAAIALFITTAGLNEVRTALIWLAGSLHAASWDALWLALPWGLGSALVLLALARQGEVAALGPALAVGLGLRASRVAALRLLASVALTAACVSATGSLGFVGLVAPHIARLAVGRGEAMLLAGSAATGALLLLAADTIGRAAFAPLQIPAGIVLAILGGPVFLFLLWRRRNQL